MNPPRSAAPLWWPSAEREAVHDDQLLPCLHDPDAEVRRLCEQTLIARGLRREYLELGRLLTDPHPGKRLQVLERLDESTELDPGLWLRRLSHDTSPSIRVAAIRAMASRTSSISATASIKSLVKTAIPRFANSLSSTSTARAVMSLLNKKS